MRNEETITYFELLKVLALLVMEGSKACNHGKCMGKVISSTEILRKFCGPNET